MNSVGAGRLADAEQAVLRLLKLKPGFRASHAHGAFPIQLAEERDRLIAALRKAGVPA